MGLSFSSGIYTCALYPNQSNILTQADQDEDPDAYESSEESDRDQGNDSQFPDPPAPSQTAADLPSPPAPPQEPSASTLQPPTTPATETATGESGVFVACAMEYGSHISTSMFAWGYLYVLLPSFL